MLTIGAFCFGSVVGWICYRILRRIKSSGISDLAAIVGVIGGAAVTQIFPSRSDSFGAYCIGLFFGFFGYLIVAGFIDIRVAKKPELKSASKWLGSEAENLLEQEKPDIPIAGR